MAYSYTAFVIASLTFVLRAHVF